MRRELESMAEAYGGHSLSQSYIKKADASEVRMALPSPTIIVSGITASYLLVEYHCRRSGSDWNKKITSIIAAGRVYRMVGSIVSLIVTASLIFYKGL